LGIWLLLLLARTLQHNRQLKRCNRGLQRIIRHQKKKIISSWSNNICTLVLHAADKAVVSGVVQQRAAKNSNKGNAAATKA
jgi:hypothetical protein